MGTAFERRRKVWATIDEISRTALCVLISIEVSMPRISWATRAQQWWRQWDATPKGEANPLNSIQVQIEGCNSPS